MDLLIFWDSGAPAGLEIPVMRMLSGILGTPVKVCENPLILEGYVGSRRQTDASVLLDTIDIFKQRQSIRNPILVITGNDIFSGTTASLFGLARPSAGAAVVSTARLSNEFYGREGDEDDLIDRMVKEGSHEIGHLFGLDHCITPECIMHNPLTLDDLERKKRWFCPGCKDLLDSARLINSLS